MQRLVERAVDIVLAVDLDRRKQAGQRARGFDCAGYGHVIMPGRAERDRTAGVEIGRDEEEPRRQLAEIVRSTGCCEQVLQEAIDRAVVEQTRRQRARQRGERLHQAVAQRVAQILQRRPRGKGGQRREATPEVAEDGAQVWGVVYEIADVDLGKLDASEGFRPGRTKNSYVRRECLVFVDGEEQQPLRVSAYFAAAQSTSLIGGQKFRGL